MALSKFNVFGRLFSDAHVDNPVGGEVLISSYKHVAIPVLEDDALDFIQAIEVLDGSYDGFSRIVRKYIDSHGKASLAPFGSVWEVEVKGDELRLRRRLGWRRQFLWSHLGARDYFPLNIHFLRLHDCVRKHDLAFGGVLPAL
jgi:hypothetical protein